MPIPGDNGHPKAERDAQNKRITSEAQTGACVQKELILNKEIPSVDCIFGVPKR